VIAEAGVNWGEFDAATQEHGLATTGGRVTTTGIAGLSNTACTSCRRC
jgi:hypothetical protein